MEIDGVSESREYWPMARAANLDLDFVTTRRVNVLLMGTERMVRDVLDNLAPKLRAPIQTWRAPDPLELPAPADVGTLILREVGALSSADQRRLLAWLDAAAGRIQVVSTTASWLLRRVETNDFLDTLYYRLNTVCIDLTE
jgi:sigma-54-interacting transcriptional regulator